MEKEEIKEASKEEVVSEESDFADENKPEPVKPEGKSVEEFEKKEKELAAQEADNKAKEEIKEYKEKAKEFQKKEMVGKKEVITYDYPDERCLAIENSRKEFDGGYNKTQRIKALVSFVALAGIIVGWILPATLIKDNASLTLIITLIVAGVGILAIAICSFLIKRKNKVRIAKYFASFYDNANAYAFDGLGISSLQGSVENKITDDEMRACELYGNISAVGSRDNITFTYKNTDFALADAAAQKDAGKSLATVFVGKYLRAANKVEPSSPVVIYFKGNERALPPSVINEMNVLEDSKSFAIYGNPADKKIISKDLKVALKKIHTDRLLVDLAISIHAGRTYFCIGYEDDLMVLPMKEAFNPYYLKRYKEDLPNFLDIATLLNK